MLQATIKEAMSVLTAAYLCLVLFLVLCGVVGDAVSRGHVSRASPQVRHLTGILHAAMLDASLPPDTHRKKEG